MYFYIIINIINAISSLLFSILVVTYFGLTNLGEVSFVIALVSTLSTLINRQSWQIVYDNQDNFEYAGKIARLKDFRCNIVGSLLAIVLIIYSFLFSQLYIAIISILLIFHSHSSLTALLRIRGYAVLAAIYKTPFLLLRLIILLFFSYEKTILNLALFFVLPEIFGIILLFIFDYKTRVKNAFLSSSHIKIRNGAYKSALIDLPINHLDTLAIGLSVSSENLGLFRFGKTIMQSAAMVIKPVLDWFTPKVTKSPNMPIHKIYLPFVGLAFLFLIFLENINLISSLSQDVMDSLLILVNVPYFNIVLSLFIISTSMGIYKARMYGHGYDNKDVWILLISNCLYLLGLLFFSSDEMIWMLFLMILIQSMLLTAMRLFYLKHAL